MRNRTQHEANRLLRFDGGTVSGPESTGQVDAVTTGRTEPRTGLTNLLPAGKLTTGDRLVIFGSGDNELPVAAGINPWIC